MEEVLKILAFGHQKRVGKDTASSFVSTHLRVEKGVRRVTKAGLADKLKDVCHQLYSWAGLKDKEFYESNPAAKEVPLPLIGKSPREIWIAFGNEVKDSVFHDTWLEYLLRNTKADWLIVSDMRFPNEADRIRQLGGLVIKIVRPSIPHTSDAADDPLLDYQHWDHIITNDGSFADFNKQVIGVVDGYEASSKSSVRP
jgi:hypothetical protein